MGTFVSNTTGLSVIQEENSQTLTHICLDELRPLLSYPRNEAKHVDFLLGVHHVNHCIYDNKGSCSPNTGAGDTQTKSTQSKHIAQLIPKNIARGKKKEPLCLKTYVSS